MGCVRLCPTLFSRIRAFWGLGTYGDRNNNNNNNNKNNNNNNNNNNSNNNNNKKGFNKYAKLTKEENEKRTKDNEEKHERYKPYEANIHEVNIDLRVPVSSFKSIMLQIQAIGERDNSVQIQSSNSNANDVTSQYIDSSSRHSSLLATHKSLLNVMASATSTRDVMEVQRELNSVSQQIESQKQSMNYFEKGAALSSIHLRLTENQPIPITIPPEEYTEYPGDGDDDTNKKNKGWSPFKTIKKAADSLCKIIAMFVDSFIYSVVIGVPLFIVLKIFHTVVIVRGNNTGGVVHDNAV